jgi:hypothetical protein
MDDVCVTVLLSVATLAGVLGRLGDETTETCSEESERERFLHGLLAAGDAQMQPVLNVPCGSKD